MRVVLHSASLAVAAALVSPTLVHAYCRTTTVEQTRPGCPEECITDGLPLYWGQPAPTYIFNERGFPGLDDLSMREALRLSFGAWNVIQCAPDNHAIGLEVTEEPGTTTLEVGPPEDEPNDNVIVHFSGATWKQMGLSDQAYALTAIWYNKNTGEILGADMHFNGGMGQFTVCPDAGCPETGGRTLIDLRNVATHEAGHFIGLAHSDVERSTMWCSAQPDEVEKRSLANDDIAGACSIYPAALASGAGSSEGESNGGAQSSRGCSVGPGRPSPWWLAGLMFALGLLALRPRASQSCALLVAAARKPALTDRRSASASSKAS